MQNPYSKTFLDVKFLFVNRFFKIFAAHFRTKGLLNLLLKDLANRVEVLEYRLSACLPNYISIQGNIHYLNVRWVRLESRGCHVKFNVVIRRLD